MSPLGAWSRDPDGQTTRRGLAFLRMEQATLSGDIYPCIIYQRLRPSAPEASEYARKTIWPLADKLVAHEGYTLCGLYGDSEFAPPYCGGSEIRPGFELAMRRTKQIAREIGTCALLVGDGSAIGDGDPFLPSYAPSDLSGVDIRVVNFHLRSHARTTNLRAAWRYFDHYREAEARSQPSTIPIGCPAVTREIQIVIRRDPERLLANLYVTNPLPAPLRLEWQQIVRRPDRNVPDLQHGDWHTLVIPGRC